MSFRDFPLVRVLPNGKTVACICGDLLYRGETDPNCPAHDDELVHAVRAIDTRRAEAEWHRSSR